MSKFIIAVCGFAGSGKDTACDYLVKRHGFKKTNFASPLKAMAKIAFGFSDEQLYGPSSKREEPDLRYPFTGTCTHCGRQCDDAKAEGLGEPYWPAEKYRYHCEPCNVDYPEFVTPRLALQSLGTEWGRRLHGDLWAKAAINHINDNDHERWCLSDLRFVNEFDAVQSAKGFNIRLMRGELVHNHASETELQSIPLSTFDMAIFNMGELDQLYLALDAAVIEFDEKRQRG